MKRSLIIGSNGTIGSALQKLMLADNELYTISQSDTDYCDDSLALLSSKLKEKGDFHTIICCIGVLHNDVVAPEKSLTQIKRDVLAEYFRINTILPAMCLKAFAPLLSKRELSRFTFLSAMVGSIEDNALGGWYGYRSSKAALNMMVKTASIELARTNKQASIAAIHPGTTQGPLSKPFAAGINRDKYYTPEQSAKRILQITESLQAVDTGSFYNWDGRELPW